MSEDERKMMKADLVLEMIAGISKPDVHISERSSRVYMGFEIMTVAFADLLGSTWTLTKTVRTVKTGL